MTITQLLVTALAPYIPAMGANMAPVIATKWNLFSWLNKPIDFGYQWRGERLFGSHKTFRGVVVACVAGAILGALQSAIAHQSVVGGAAVGGLVGFGAITGDVIKSFFKRRLHVASGVSWIPFDQIDFVLGATVVLMMLQKISYTSAFISIIVIGFLSYVVSAIAFALHIKKNL